MEKTIKVARYRSFPYIVNYLTNGGTKTYQWAGSKGKKVDIKPIPEEVVDYLMMNSACFRQGDLVIIEDTEDAKELVENIDDVDQYKNNSQNKDEITKILTGNFNKMKSELNKVTNKDQKKFIVDTAKEIKLDSDSKLKFIAEWFGVKRDILFSDED
ncbi:hypothetical protein [Lederbergia lenta]|uniref:hypothetical protein n=1 Tax=Lederbergia lenta TaxID=1467 RepID=UPI002041E665|nr:hypothetical protein [Lederbergia lenta]MCM3110031.1 hypothetical protein [Lederbergia lenta]